eukprot:1153558-Pelagomonas_calceolata.AAC.2
MDYTGFSALWCSAISGYNAKDSYRPLPFHSAAFEGRYSDGALTNLAQRKQHLRHIGLQEMPADERA